MQELNTVEIQDVNGGNPYVAAFIAGVIMGYMSAE
jgi:hypothetical protein